jgi:tetratricopeptide (TPR) repeat protein
MFSDVSGFTAISEKLDPEDVHAIMDRVFEVILNAVHYYEGTVNQFQVWAKAANYLRQAAAKAQVRAAHREALASLEEALEVLRHLPEALETRAQEIDVRIDLRGALYPLGEFEKMLVYLREAEEIATAISDSRRPGLSPSTSPSTSARGDGSPRRERSPSKRSPWAPSTEIFRSNSMRLSMSGSPAKASATIGEHPRRCMPRKRPNGSPARSGR